MTRRSARRRVPCCHPSSTPVISGNHSMQDTRPRRHGDRWTEPRGAREAAVRALCRSSPGSGTPRPVRRSYVAPLLGTVAADELGPGVLGQPGYDGGRLAVAQQVDRALSSLP